MLALFHHKKNSKGMEVAEILFGNQLTFHELPRFGSDLSCAIMSRDFLYLVRYNIIILLMENIHMINTARVSVRGQVAVPKAIREKMSIKEGDVLLFEEKGEGTFYVRKVENFFDLIGTLPPVKMSFVEIRDKAMKEMAKEAADDV